MAALALLLPRRKCLDLECCHWLARKQKAANQTPAQRTAGARREETWRSVLGRATESWGPLVLSLKANLWRGAQCLTAPRQLHQSQGAHSLQASHLS